MKNSADWNSGMDGNGLTGHGMNGVPFGCREELVSTDYADYVISYNGNEEGLRFFFQGECLSILDNQLAILTVDRNNINLMTVISQLYYMVPKCYGLMDTTSMEESGILRAQNQPVLNLKGSNILVGIIDTGACVCVVS